MQELNVISHRRIVERPRRSTGEQAESSFFEVSRTQKSNFALSEHTIQGLGSGVQTTAYPLFETFV